MTDGPERPVVRPAMSGKEQGRGRTTNDLDNSWLTTMSMNASPVHLDAAGVADGPFGGSVMLGALTVAIAEGLSSQSLPPDAGLVRGWESIRLLGPVLVGDTISVTRTKLPTRSEDGQRYLRLRTRAFAGGTMVADIITRYGSIKPSAASAQSPEPSEG